MSIIICSLSIIRTGFRASLFPVFSEWNSMNPNLSKMVISSLTDLKSLPRSFARAYIDFGFLDFRAKRILAFSLLSRFLRSFISEKSWDFFSPISFETKLPLSAFTSTYLIFVFFFSTMRGASFVCVFGF